ncbi:carbamate kinase [Paraburkholderia sp. EB58]|jgi:carbamate kinase|uniref:carbamate kinase n=1 Tax=Paraburkholderia sp. EB58 TaxID=3035125 RepID=UPI003D21F1BC
MRIVVALGANALLKRGEAASAQAQQDNIRLAAVQLAKVADGNSLVIVHGNGPQVGVPASQGKNAPAAEQLPLDAPDAQTQDMTGYAIELELGNLLPSGRSCATLLTMVEVNPADPAFKSPDKPIGAVFTEAEAALATRDQGWTVTQDGAAYRRVVASPKPVRILEMQPVRWLLAHSTIVICAGGGGIPFVVEGERRRLGVEAVVDKDRSAALLARELEADLLVIVTDVAGVYLDWGAPSARLIRLVSPDALDRLDFAADSMAPKIEAACDFVKRTGHRAVIGALDDIEQMIAGTAGTSIKRDQMGLVEG